uniref:Uncharacterized protein n=1 Tax=Siphoviridae sp. ctr4Z12 TaxID=2827280 RepID=A0A8S5R649_9CAUD|nr:MAG TPA: hypothetical protein [Siphoviridae sp. ctr4Z12]
MAADVLFLHIFRLPSPPDDGFHTPALPLHLLRRRADIYSIKSACSNTYHPL